MVNLKNHEVADPFEVFFQNFQDCFQKVKGEKGDIGD